MRDISRLMIFLSGHPFFFVVVAVMMMMVDGVENKRHRHIHEEDRISAIPDSLIHHILSFLKMKDVIKTSLLSRRWRNLWRSIPVLDFGYYCPRRRGDTTFIDLTLMLYNGRKIQRFHANFLHEIDSCHLDSWIRFVMMRDVEELDIHFFTEYYEFENEILYKLPFSILDGGQFKVLVLESCVLSFPKSFCFRSLTKLHLSCVDFTDLDTSGCPLLEVLVLEGCSRSLNIHAPNQKLRYLKMHDYETVLVKNSCLNLYAPNLLSIEFHDCLRGSYNCKNLSSLERAFLGFCLSMDENLSDETDVESLVGLLKNLSCAKTLKLSEESIRILVLVEENYIETLSLSATVLELETTLDEFELNDVLASLLRNNHCLETLIINTGQVICDADEVFSWELLEIALSGRLQLRTVIIRNFFGSRPEQLCRGSKLNVNMDEFIKNWPEDLELVKVVLKSCKMLDKLIIRTVEMLQCPYKLELLLSLAKKLLQFPRASVTAEISFS